jgi:hypothetical protein
MPFLLAQCPSFEPSWSKHREWWDGEEAGNYNDITEFVQFVIAEFERGDITLVRTGFNSNSCCARATKRFETLPPSAS